MFSETARSCDKRRSDVPQQRTLEVGLLIWSRQKKISAILNESRTTADHRSLQFDAFRSERATFSKRSVSTDPSYRFGAVSKFLPACVTTNLLDRRWYCPQAKRTTNCVLVRLRCRVAARTTRK